MKKIKFISGEISDEVAIRTNKFISEHNVTSIQADSTWREYGVMLVYEE